MLSIKKILIASLVLMAQFSFSQDSKVSLEANLPISLGSNFFGKDFDGFIDIGAKYRIVSLSNINLGVSVNGSYFKKEPQRYMSSHPGDFPDPYDASEMTNFTILPRVYAELKMNGMPKLRPHIGLGYSFLLFNAASTDFGLSSSVYLNGINANVGMNYFLSTRIFAQIQYDYINLFDKEVPWPSTNNNVSLIKLGMGVML